MEKKLFISGKQIINANINNFTSGVYILYFSKNDISITSKIIKL